MANVTAKTSSNIFYKARCEAATHNEQLSSREGAADYMSKVKWLTAAFDNMQGLMDLAESPKVAIKSGQGVGKTGMEAVALLWFLCCYPYPRIVATAPTKQQLDTALILMILREYITERNTIVFRKISKSIILHLSEKQEREKLPA